MANEEALVLDGLALNDGTTFGMLSFDAPVPRQRQDWIGAADSEAMLLVRNPLHDNRKITVRLAVVPQASMNVAHDKLLLVLDKLQKASRYTDGIAMTWTPATGTRTATFDVLSAEIVDLPIDWENGWLAFTPQFTVEMTAKPYWRGTETLTSTASSSTPVVTLEVAGVTGDVPALGRLIVTDTASQSRRHVEWGLEGPLTYNSSTSLLLDSDSLVTSGFAGTQSAGASGAYDPNATGNSSIFLSIAGLNAPTAVCGTGNQSHVGTFRVKGRLYSTNGSTTQYRLSWRAGDGPMVSNEWATVPVAAQWCELDLGSITVPAATVGSQRWTGQLEILDSSSVSLTAYVDYLVLVPTGDGYGKARASYAYQAGVVAGYDSFAGTTAGNALNARTAPAGGSWVTSGSTTDFVFADDLSGEQIKRSTVSDSGPRFGILGATNYTDVQVETLTYRSSATSTGDVEQGVITRWVDSSNYLRATSFRDSTGATRRFAIIQRVAGVETTLKSFDLYQATGVWSFNAYYCVRLVVLSSGRVLAALLNQAKTSTLAALEATSTALATAGTLATGKPGVYDYVPSATSGSRYYDDFTLSTPAAEPIALYSGRNMQVRYDDVIRQDSTGTYTGRPPSYRGSRFLVPVGTSRVLVKARRNDIETSADDNVTDATQVQVGWTARGLAVPR